MTSEPELCMPVWKWPSRERTRWGKACRPADPFDPDVGRASLWKQSTRDNYVLGYGQWLSWLERRGELDRAAEPGERVTLERLQAFFAELKEAVAPYTQANYLMGLARVLSAMDPAGDYGWIARASLRIHREARPVTDVTEKLQPVEAVYQLGLDMMWEAEHGRFRSVTERATLYRDGLMLALMVLRPLRISNFASIVIGEHLRRRNGGWWLTFPAEEMKNARPFECPFPEQLEQALDCYLAVHRDVLTGAEEASGVSDGPLWISLRGKGRLTAADLRYRIEKVTREEFGPAINPHAMRHLLATTNATYAPEDAPSNATMLGHTGIETSQEYYNKARMADAADRYQDTVARIRKAGRR